MSDPIDEMAAVIRETLAANALMLTSSRGGYVGGGNPHPTRDSDPAAVDAIARGLLARRVAEPSRALPAREAAADRSMDCGRNPKKSPDSGWFASYHGAGSSAGET